MGDIMTFEQILALIGTVLAILIFVLPYVIKLTEAITSLNVTIAELGKRLDNHETRIERLEECKQC